MLLSGSGLCSLDLFNCCITKLADTLRWLSFIACKTGTRVGSGTVFCKVLYPDDGLPSKFMVQAVKKILSYLYADTWKIRQKIRALLKATEGV